MIVGNSGNETRRASKPVGYPKGHGGGQHISTDQGSRALKEIVAKSEDCSVATSWQEA